MLREGIVIDPTAPIAYVMSVGGGIVAVDLGSGAERWKSNQRAKPLAVVQDLVITQVESAQPASDRTLVVAGLDVRSGESRTDASAELDPSVHVTMGEGRDGTFSINALPSDGGVILTWDYQPLPLRRRMQTRPERSAPEAADFVRPSGVLRFEPSAKKLSPVFGLTSETLKPEKRWLLFTERDPSAKALERWYGSADDRHVLKSELTGKSTEWEKYRWTVTERETGRVLGRMRSHLSFTPFVVRDGTIVFDTTPYTRDGREEPAKLRGVSLETGKQVWEVLVREIVWRGPMPP